MFPLSSFGGAVATYFPMSDGDNKVYTFTMGSEVINMELTYSRSDPDWEIYLETDSVDDSRVTYETGGQTLTMLGTFLEDDYLSFDQPLVVASDNLLQNGGRISASTTAQYHGADIIISSETIVSKIDTVVVPVGGYADCRSVSFRVNVYIEETGYSADLNNVWTLAPYVGKIQIEVVDQYNNHIDTAELISGQVSGKDVSGYAMSEQAVTVLPGMQLLLLER